MTMKSNSSSKKTIWLYILAPLGECYLVVSLLFVFLTAFNGLCQAQDYAVTVSAGGFDRLETVISVTFPKPVKPGVYQLTNQTGDKTPIQVNEYNTGWFIVDKLPAGASKTYTFAPETSAISVQNTGITYNFDQNIVTFQKEGASVFSYYYRFNNPPKELGPIYKRAGYIHPLFSPDGVPLTNHLDFKMHSHHYGIWAAWTHTKFQGRTPDFWNIQDGSARVEHADSLQKIWQGPVYGGLKAKNHYVDLSSSAPVIALNEEWVTRVYNTSSLKGREYNFLDLKLTHTTNTAQPLKLPEYRYGGLAFRGHQQWDNPKNVSFLTSEGYNRKNGNKTRARWVHIGGTVNGKQVGVAILGHPDNFRAPQPVRINPETPYIVFAPMQLGNMVIKPGSPYVMRYRFVTYDGKPDVGRLNQLWDDYAYPVGVTVHKK